LTGGYPKVPEHNFIDGHVIRKLKKLEMSLQGHLYEHSYVLGSENGGHSHTHEQGQRHSLARNAKAGSLVLEPEHHVHAPEQGVWRGEDFSI
jgi:hypothetical protein